MKVLIVHAHENPDSFCAALFRKAVEDFTKNGHQVMHSDLYAMGFNPVGARHDFTKLSDASYYKYAMEQLAAARSHSFAPDIQLEIDKLLHVDFLIFNFPLWWYSMPAILKGWVDRVMAYGVAYGGDFGYDSAGRFAGKRAMVTATTGTPIGQYQKPIEDILDNIHSGIFALVGFEVVPPFIASAVSRITADERSQLLEKYASYLGDLMQQS